MEQQAKERLTGGIILVALLVFLVPELLSGPATPVPPAQPAPDQAPMRSYTVDLNDGSQQGSAPVAASAQQVDAPVMAQPAMAAAQSAPAAATMTAAPASTPVSAAAAPAPPHAAPEAAAPAPAPLHAAPPSPATAPAPQAAVRTAAAAPAGQDHKRPAAAAASHPSAGGGWTVQLGVFSSRANAQRLAAGLEHKGFAVRITETGGNSRRLYRVRAGAEHDRAAAQRLLDRLHAAGQRDGAIVSP